jgi:hypothetical protein
MLAKLQEKWHSMCYSHVFESILLCVEITHKTARTWQENGLKFASRQAPTKRKPKLIAQRNCQKLRLRKKYITLELPYLRMDILIYGATTPPPHPFLPGSSNIHPLDLKSLDGKVVILALHHFSHFSSSLSFNWMWQSFALNIQHKARLVCLIDMI